MRKLSGQNPFQPVAGFFNLLFWTWRFRARLEHPAPGWMVLEDPLAPHVQPDVPEQHQDYARGSGLPPTHKFSFPKQPVDHLLLIQQLIQGKKVRRTLCISEGEFTDQWCTFETASDWLQVDKPISQSLSKESPNLPQHRSRWFLQIAQTAFEKDGHWERKHSLATYPLQTGSAVWLLPRE